MLCAMERDAGDTEVPGAHEAGAEVLRLRPLHVLVVSPDRRFRSVIEMLMARRGCSAAGTADSDDVAQTIVRERVDVVLVDGMGLLREVARDVAQSDASAPPVGVVLVSESVEPGLAGPLALAKWDRFDELFEAIVEADRARVRPRAQEQAAGLSVARTREHG
jgi:CheY-like chemotaxis protein